MSFALIRATTANPPTMTGPPHTHPARLDLNGFARAAAVHPELVQRLVTLGLLEPERDASGALWFVPAHLTELARIQRLRAGLGLNYAALGLVVDLLDRIAELEAARRVSGRRVAGRPWPAGPQDTRRNPTRHIGD